MTGDGSNFQSPGGQIGKDGAQIAGGDISNSSTSDVRAEAGAAVSPGENSIAGTSGATAKVGLREKVKRSRWFKFWASTSLLSLAAVTVLVIINVFSMDWALYGATVITGALAALTLISG